MLARLLTALILALSLPLAPASAQSGAGRLLLWNADTGAHTSAAIDADGDLVLGEPGSQVLALLKGSPLPKIVATKMGLVIAGAISARKSGIQVLAIGNDGSLRYGPASTSCTDRDAPLIAPTVPPFLVCISATQGNAVVVEVENDLKTTERFRGALDLEDVGSLSFKQLIPTTQGALALLSGSTPLLMMRVENGGGDWSNASKYAFRADELGPLAGDNYLAIAVGGRALFINQTGSYRSGRLKTTPEPGGSFQLASVNRLPGNVLGVKRLLIASGDHVMIYDPNGHYTVGVLDQSGAFAITDHGTIGGLYTSIARAGRHLILMNRTGRAQTGSINASGKFVASPPFEAWPYQYVAGTDG